MKNLLIYVGPNKKFDEETAVLVKIQIENSLELGWKKEDILLVTDFEYEYMGVKAMVVKKDVYYPKDLAASKIPVILYLIEIGFIEPGKLYWSHDFDAYQVIPFDEKELGLEKYDLGLVHYFYKPEWSCGSLFFKAEAKDILELWDKTMRERPYRSRNNEKTLTWLIKHKKIDPRRYKKLNVTYNIMKRCLATVYNEATKPVRVLHFHPWEDKDFMMLDNTLNTFMYGKNRLKILLMTDRLIEIFNQHGIK